MNSLQIYRHGVSALFTTIIFAVIMGLTRLPTYRLTEESLHRGNPAGA